LGTVEGRESVNQTLLSVNKLYNSKSKKKKIVTDYNLQKNFYLMLNLSRFLCVYLLGLGLLLGAEENVGKSGDCSKPEPQSFDAVTIFEEELAKFFGAKYAVGTDCATHGIELSLRYLMKTGMLNKETVVEIPKRTYISIPFLGEKLGLNWVWKDERWQDYYYVGGTNVIDAAVLWKENSYVANTMMAVSFQFQKHLSLGRGGVILLDNLEASVELRKMVYDGRERGVGWRSQNITSVGYHYYMTPEIAELGMGKLPAKIVEVPRKWTVADWPDLSEMAVFASKKMSVNGQDGGIV